MSRCGEVVHNSCEAKQELARGLSTLLYCCLVFVALVRLGIELHPSLFMPDPLLHAMLRPFRGLSRALYKREKLPYSLHFAREAPWWKLGGYVLCILGMMAGMVLLTEGHCSSWYTAPWDD